MQIFLQAQFLQNQHPKKIILLAILLAFHAKAYCEDAQPKGLLSDQNIVVNQNIAPFNAPTLSNQPPQALDDAVKNARQQNHPSQPLDLSLPKSEIFEENRAQKNSDAKNNNIKNISLADVRRIALENNLGVQIATFEPSIAQTQVREERAKFDQIIFANLKYTQKDTPTSSMETVKFSSEDSTLNNSEVKLTQTESETDYIDGELGVLVPLRTGAKVKLSSPFYGKDSDNKSAKLSSEEYKSAVKFSISQPLLRNAGVAVNEASIRISELDKNAVEAKTKLQSIRILSTVDKAYWEVTRAWNELDVRRQQHEYASQNLDMVKKRVKAGLSAAIEINRAEIGVADRMESLIIAKTKLKLAQRQLKFFLNHPDDSITSETNFVPSSQPQLLFYAFDREKLISQALAGRLELLEQELKLSADLNKIDYLKNQTLPIFNLEYQYGALSDARSSFSQSYGTISDGRFNEWAVGFNFEMPFSNEARKAQLERAVLNRQQRLATKGLQELSIKKEILDTVDEIEQNWQRIVAARQQVLIAGINYEAELKQFKEGLRTMTEVLESMTRLGEAQIKEIRAINEYQASNIDLAYATGTLLGFSQVEI